jgi:ferredoxin-type protein NapH
VTGKSVTPRRVSRTMLVIGALFPFILWPLAAIVLSRGNALGFALALVFSGLQGPLLAGYALTRTSRKQRWRWLVLASGGLGILLFSLVDAVNLDLHGFFELLLLGTAGAAIGHTMVTTIVGPLVCGRVLCGWGCWRAMVLERLPVGKGSGRSRGVWVWTPVVGVAVSLSAAALVVPVLDFRSRGPVPADSVWTILAGVAVCYAAALALALALSDRRAFCKYLCPTGFLLRWTSRRALLHVSARVEECNECGACLEVCPMDIPIVERM